MSRICLDTCAYSHLKRGTPSAVAVIRSATWVGMPAVVLGELRAGFLLGARAIENEEELAAFCAEPVVHIMAIDGECARHYAEIVVALRRVGTPIPTNDLWIAAAGAASGSAVLTYDGHFRHIARVASIILA